MATDENIPEEINQQLNEMLGITEDNSNNEEYVPTYRMYGENKIPISKEEGKLWHQRAQQAYDVMKDVTDQWDLTYNYFNADHINYTDSGEVKFKQDKVRKNYTNTENLVWSNNIGTLPALYSQDPSVEITTNKKNDELSEKLATMLERLVNVLFSKRVAPGLNLKPKVRKAILNTLLTNRGILKIGFTFKSEATEQVMADIQKISEQLINAKDIKEIKDLEGKLKSLDEMVNFTSESGVYIKHIRPYDLFIDPAANDQDGTDAAWIMEREYIPTEYLKAKFGIDNPNNEEVMSVYKPNKVLQVNNKATVEQNNDEDALTLTDSDEVRYETYGYDNAEAFKRSCLTECFWIWDKIKRRVYLYSNNNWEYPIWVWEDPYELEEFYPYYILNFQESPNNTLCKGETSYYLDQQDAINMINAQLQKMRNFGFNSYLFDANSGIKIEDLQRWCNNNEKLVGISLPPDKKWEDILFAGQVPADKNQALYDKTDLLRVVDMISGTDATTRSGEYKTNTTNLAIQTYTAGKSIRLDDKRDAIENWIGNIGWGIAQLCIMYMNKEQVDKLIGNLSTENWRNMDRVELTNTFSLRVVGGSTVKPTSDVKKQQALQISQVLGQFASATPYVSIVMLNVLQRAFDEPIVNEEDIEMIKNSILQQLQAQQMQAQQQAMLADAQAQEAVSNADRNVVESANIMSQLNGMPAENQQQTPDMLLNGETNG